MGERFDKLNSIGFVWSGDEDPCVQPKCQIRNKQIWEEMFQLLKSYKEEFNKTYLVGTMKYRGRNLGRWVHRQRQLELSWSLEGRSNGQFDQERFDKLNSIGFAWNRKLSDKSCVE